MINITLVQDSLSVSDSTKNELIAAFRQSGANILDERGLGKWKTTQANKLTSELISRREYVVRVLPRYEAIHEQNPEMVTYGRTYKDKRMCSLVPDRTFSNDSDFAPASGLCQYCKDGKRDCEFKKQENELKTGNFHVTFTVPKMLPYVLSLWAEHYPIVIIDDCDINDIVYPSEKYEFEWFGKILYGHSPLIQDIRPLFDYLEKRDVVGAQTWIQDNKHVISSSHILVQKEIVKNAEKGIRNLKDLNGLANFFALCENDVTLKDRKGVKGQKDTITISRFDISLLNYRFIYQNATLTTSQRETIENLSRIRGLECLSEKCLPNEHWRVIAIKNAKYVKQSCIESERFHKIYRTTIHLLDYIKRYTGREFAEFSQKYVFNECLSGLINDIGSISHFNHYGNGVSSVNSIDKYYSVVIAGTLAPHPSFFDRLPYLDRNSINTTENKDWVYPVSQEVAQEITDSFKEQEMGRILRYDGEQDITDKLVFILGTAPKYETIIDEETGKEIKYLPNSGAIIEEYMTYNYEKGLLRALRPWLEEAIINHAMNEKPERINDFSKQVAKELNNSISFVTIQRILEKSNRFNIGSRKIDGNNKPRKIFEWTADFGVNSVDMNALQAVEN